MTIICQLLSEASNRTCRSSTVVISRAGSRRSAAGRFKWRWNSHSSEGAQRERALGIQERSNADSLRLQLSTLSGGEPDKRFNPQVDEPAARAALPPLRLFVEFLEYLANSGLADDSSEDAGMWQAVLAHQAYREAHPEEAPEVFESPVAFLKAAANL